MTRSRRDEFSSQQELNAYRRLERSMSASDSELTALQSAVVALQADMAQVQIDLAALDARVTVLESYHAGDAVVMADSQNANAMGAMGLVSFGAGVVVGDSQNANAAGSMVLTGSGTIAIGDSQNANAMGSMFVTPNYALVMADSQNANAMGSMTLTASGELSLGDSQNVNVMGSMTLTANTPVTIGDSQNANAMGSMELSAGFTLVLADSQNANAMGSMALAANTPVAMQDSQNANAMAAPITVTFSSGSSPWTLKSTTLANKVIAMIVSDPNDSDTVKDLVTANDITVDASVTTGAATSFKNAAAHNYFTLGDAGVAAITWNSGGRPPAPLGTIDNGFAWVIIFEEWIGGTGEDHVLVTTSVADSGDEFRLKKDITFTRIFVDGSHFGRNDTSWPTSTMFCAAGRAISNRHPTAEDRYFYGLETDTDLSVDWGDGSQSAINNGDDGYEMEFFGGSGSNGITGKVQALILLDDSVTDAELEELFEDWTTVVNT